MSARSSPPLRASLDRGAPESANCLFGKHELADFAVAIIDDEQLAVEVLGERGNLQGIRGAGRRAALGDELLDVEAAGAVGLEPGDHAAEIGKDIVARDLRRLQPAVHVAAGDREAEVVAVLRDRIGEALGVAVRRRLEAVRTLADIPAVIAASAHEVDFLPVRLADVTNPKVARL